MYLICKMNQIPNIYNSVAEVMVENIYRVRIHM